MGRGSLTLASVVAAEGMKRKDDVFDFVVFAVAVAIGWEREKRDLEALDGDAEAGRRDGGGWRGPDSSSSGAEVRKGLGSFARRRERMDCGGGKEGLGEDEEGGRDCCCCGGGGG